MSLPSHTVSDVLRPVLYNIYEIKCTSVDSSIYRTKPYDGDNVLAAFERILTSYKIINIELSIIYDEEVFELVYTRNNQNEWTYTGHVTYYDFEDPIPPVTKQIVQGIVTMGPNIVDLHKLKDAIKQRTV